MTQEISYKVRLKDQGGVVIAEFDNWVTLRFGQRVNSPGFYSFQIEGDDPRISLFQIDGQIEVWRRSQQNGIDWYLEFEGLHRSEVRKTNANGSRFYTSNGRGYIDLLSRRIIAYRSLNSGSKKFGQVEDIMKDYVLENLGLAAIAPPRLADGVLPGLSVEASASAGPFWRGSRSFRNLLEVVQDLSTFGSIDYSIVGTTPLGGPPSWEFRTHVGQLGLDKTVQGLDLSTGLNGAGNVPVVFSIGRGNMLEPQYSLSNLDEVNALFALGKGVAGVRKVVEVTDPTGLGLSPFNRREGSRNGSSQRTNDELTDFGTEWLAKLIAKENVVFRVLQIPSVAYGLGSSTFPGSVLYHLGDKVTIQYDDIERDKRIVGSDISVSGRQVESIGIEFADLPSIGATFARR